MDNLLVVVPSRGRPDNVARLEEARMATCSPTSGVRFVYAVDLDDPELPHYRALDLDRLYVLDIRVGLCRILNQLAVRYAAPGMFDAIGFMGDDHLPRTLGWDLHVLQALDSPLPRVVYGNDLLQGPNLPTAVFMHSRVIRALGFMAPSAMHHLYLDNFWRELGEGLGGLVYLPDVVIEHLHPAAGKAAMDEGYARVNSAEADAGDREAWKIYREASLAGALARVRGEYAAEYAAANSGRSVR